MAFFICIHVYCGHVFSHIQHLATLVLFYVILTKFAYFRNEFLDFVFCFCYGNFADVWHFVSYIFLFLSPASLIFVLYVFCFCLCFCSHSAFCEVTPIYGFSPRFADIKNSAFRSLYFFLSWWVSFHLYLTFCDVAFFFLQVRWYLAFYLQRCNKLLRRLRRCAYIHVYMYLHA